MKKLICIFNTSHDSHCRHRVKDLREAGFSVEVFCHPRNGATGEKDADYPLVFLSDLASERYTGRLMSYAREIRAIVRAHRGEDCLYYLYGLDIALVFRCVAPGQSYLYEEADMMHLEAGTEQHPRLSAVLERIDRRVIRHAALAILTSEGFLQYHFGDVRPQNCVVVHNKADKRLLEKEVAEKQSDEKHLHFAFIGMLRYDSLYRFAKVVGERFRQHTFHFYGPEIPRFEALKTYDNVLFHGPYKNPDDLPALYEATDIVVATYDSTHTNVRYLEPNKLFEAVCMRTPIVVSEHTYVAKQVAAWGSGWPIDATHEEHIAQFISSLTAERIASCRKHIASIPREQMIADNSELIKRLQALC